ncbi:MAG TPA: polysaccharide biosynthesis/export family protein [Methyloceanibacter sp.]|nr:polysaccharide biosynthesis/export family protein [Methyloceanibacter sp.]
MAGLASDHVRVSKRPHSRSLCSVLRRRARRLQGKRRAKLTTPDFALSTPAPLPGPGEAYPAGAGSAPPGVPVAPNAIYTLDSGDRVRVIVFGQDNLSNVYVVDGSGAVALPLIGPVRARGLTTFELSNEIASKLHRK